MGEVYDPATRAVGGAVTGEATGGGAAAGRAAGGGFGRGTARGDGGSTPAEGIREAVAADASALGELAGAALTLDAEEAPRLVALLSAPPPERRWTALVTGDLDGVVFASMSARDRSVGHIDLLAVHPAARGRGAGRALVAAAEDWLRGEGRPRPGSPEIHPATPGRASTCATPRRPAWPRASATSATTPPGT
ncbi:GNAT family N-acetyltransferase [Streptosporangium lutulentum]